MKSTDKNQDKLFYDNEIQSTPSEHLALMNEIKGYYDRWSSYVDHFNNLNDGVVVELGAGSCGLSLCVSKIPSIKKIYAVDISSNRMKRLMDFSNNFINGIVGKIQTIESDFNGVLPFNDNSVDVVLFDASLHHSRSIWSTLQECNRVLKPGGMVIAQREAYLSRYRFRGQLKRLLKTPEVLANVSENIYLKEQYEYYFIANGFHPDFIKYSSSAGKRWLSILNGHLFTDGVIIARKMLFNS